MASILAFSRNFYILDTLVGSGDVAMNETNKTLSTSWSL